MTEWLGSNAGEAAAIEVGRYVDDSRDELLTLLSDIVGQESPNPPGHCDGVAGFVAAWLAKRSIACETVSRAPAKPNLVATIAGSRPGKHLILNGHMDTIGPGDPAAWSVPLYRLTRSGNKLHGLGTGNMKGALAALTLAFACLASQAGRLAGRISYTAVADETVFGPDGAGFLLEQRPDLLGDAVICGEGPGGMTLGVAEKGVLWIALEATCPPGQGMLTTRGSSAIARLSHALAEIDGWNEEQVQPPGEIAGVARSAGEHRLRLSANPGTIAGGYFVSQVASQATAEIDLRIPPGLALADLRQRLDALVTRHRGLAWRTIKGWEPNWTAETSPIARYVSSAATLVRGARPDAVVRLPASDASRWRARGIPAICFGPQPLLASGIDDYVEEQDVVDCAKIYALAAMGYLAGS